MNICSALPNIIHIDNDLTVSFLIMVKIYISTLVY
jgi:hypothetical protein